jgi:hypothetical protein
MLQQTGFIKRTLSAGALLVWIAAAYAHVTASHAASQANCRPDFLLSCPARPAAAPSASLLAANDAAMLDLGLAVANAVPAPAATLAPPEAAPRKTKATRSAAKPHQPYKLAARIQTVR